MVFLSKNIEILFSKFYRGLGNRFKKSLPPFSAFALLVLVMCASVGRCGVGRLPAAALSGGWGCRCKSVGDRCRSPRSFGANFYAGASFHPFASMTVDQKSYHIPGILSIPWIIRLWGRFCCHPRRRGE